MCLALASVDARPACPLETPHFRVGATVPYCTHTSIQAAIDAAGSTCPTVIEITPEHLYGGGFCDPNQPSGCHLAINSKNVILQGRADGETCYVLTQCIPGPSCPAPSATTPLVTLDGGNNASGRVLSISGGSNVSLRNLTIFHGAPGAAANGGGIDFTGFGNLNITRSTIANNNAGYGGGISVSGTGGTVNLRLQTNTLIQNNTAQHSGGGIRLEGSSRLFALYDQTLITFNHALDAYGGGIEILGPARADLGSPGYNGAGVVSNNDGIYGAGVAVIDNGNGEAVLRTFADNASRSTAIEDNGGGALQGGGIYLLGRADACLFASRLAGNVAEYGAAIYENSYDGSSFVADVGVYINGGAPARLGTDCGPEPIASLGGVAGCAPYDADCSVIKDNTTKHPDGSPSPGTTVGVSGDLIGERFRMSGNLANSLINSTGLLDLKRCLLTDNAVSGPLIHGFGSSKGIRSCTIAGNVIDDAFVMQFYDGPTDLELASDIVYQPSRYTVNWSSGTFDVSYILSNSTDGLPQNNPSVVQGTPQFVDTAHGDYHLKPLAQIALDFGHGSNFAFIDDLDGFYPVVNLPGIPDYLSGGADLGAYERQNLSYNCGTYDSVFCDDFDH